MCRDSSGAVVGVEDATGVVRTLSGTAVGHVGADGGIVPVSADGDSDGAADSAVATCAGWTVDQTTRGLLDSDGRVVGTAAVRRDAAEDMEGCPKHGVAAAAAAPGLELMDGVREDLGLLWGGDRTVIGSCIARVAAGMAIVSTAGKVIGDVGQDGTVLGKTGAALTAASHCSSAGMDTTKACRGGYLALSWGLLRGLVLLQEHRLPWVGEGGVREDVGVLYGLLLSLAVTCKHAPVPKRRTCDTAAVRVMWPVARDADTVILFPGA